jgi:hypothetical protein
MERRLRNSKGTNVSGPGFKPIKLLVVFVNVLDLELAISGSRHELQLVPDLEVRLESVSLKGTQGSTSLRYPVKRKKLHSQGKMDRPSPLRTEWCTATRRLLAQAASFTSD